MFIPRVFAAARRAEAERLRREAERQDEQDKFTVFYSVELSSGEPKDVPLSLLDQVAPTLQRAFVFFFEQTLDAEELQASLLYTLASYPSLAGRIILEDVR
jgi:hypothetical protein